jgi:hypothetical protein
MIVVGMMMITTIVATPSLLSLSLSLGNVLGSKCHLGMKVLGSKCHLRMNVLGSKCHLGMNVLDEMSIN